MTMNTLTLVPNNTLITATPEEGRQLAIKLARLVIKATQPDDEVRKRLREVYANDASFLIQVGHVTAIEFATIAAANDYWRSAAPR
jgi:hypothetical protein